MCHGAPVPELSTIIIRPKEGRVLIVKCGCNPANRDFRLGDMRCILCPTCKTIISRWGNRITAMGWVDCPGVDDVA
jgi:hypothetical protein